jgi:hypothetical protein
MIDIFSYSSVDDSGDIVGGRTRQIQSHGLLKRLLVWSSANDVGGLVSKNRLVFVCAALLRYQISNPQHRKVTWQHDTWQLAAFANQ